MALKALVPFDFPAAGYSESFHRCSIALDFGHVYLLFVFMANTIELFRGEKHGHIASFQSWLNIDLGNILDLNNHAAEHLLS